MAPISSPTLLMARRGSAALAALLASVSLAACTTSDSAQTETLDGARGEVQKVVNRLAERADEDDAAAICKDLLTANAQAAIGKGGDCAAGVTAAIGSADYVSLDVDSVKIVGDQAVATVTPVDKDRGARELVLERGGSARPWKISAFGPAAAKAVTAGAATTPQGTTP